VKQHEALLAFDHCLQLNQSAYKKADAIAAMYAVFYSVYFPENDTALATDVFTSPFLTFLAMYFLHPAHGYHDIWQVPPIMSKAQYTMRLRGARYLRGTLDEYLKNPNRKPWFE
jgi:hypothetical protein